MLITVPIPYPSLPSSRQAIPIDWTYATGYYKLLVSRDGSISKCYSYAADEKATLPLNMVISHADRDDFCIDSNHIAGKAQLLNISSGMTVPLDSVFKAKRTQAFLSTERLT